MLAQQTAALEGGRLQKLVKVLLASRWRRHCCPRNTLTNALGPSSVTAQQLEESASDLDTAYRRGHGNELVDTFHDHGVNLRYMGKVRSLTKAVRMRELLLAEMIARTARTRLRASLRGSVGQTTSRVHARVARVLNEMMGASHTGGMASAVTPMSPPLPSSDPGGGGGDTPRSSASDASDGDDKRASFRPIGGGGGSGAGGSAVMAPTAVSQLLRQPRSPSDTTRGQQRHAPRGGSVSPSPFLTRGHVRHVDSGRDSPGRASPSPSVGNASSGRRDDGFAFKVKPFPRPTCITVSCLTLWRLPPHRLRCGVGSQVA